MGRRRKRRARAAPPPRLEEVLSLKTRLDAPDLVNLIRQVNPTDRGLPPQEEQQRYRDKSRLQSQLIARFGAEVEVVADGRGEGVVLLRYVPGMRGACHAVSDELDDDARAWVRRRLDEQLAPGGEEAGPGPEEPPVRAPTPAQEEPADLDELSAAALTRLGQQAMEVYDYELARRALHLAVQRSRGALEAARPLLVLLVEHLATYAGALEVARDLSGEAAGDARVKGLLALAAAHLGQADRAASLIRGVQGQPAADVFKLMARTAINAGDDQRASQYIAEARPHAPADAGVISLESELEALRRSKFAQQEQAISQGLAAGRHDEAERGARALLDRWSGSEVARAALEQLDVMRERLQMEALVAQAEAALATSEFARAVELFGQAIDLGGRRRRMLVGLRAAEEGLATERERARVAEVSSMLGGDDARPGLLAYLALDLDLRARVRRDVDLEALPWLDQTGARGGGRRAGAAVEAVLALERAADRLDHGDADAALELLRAHVKALQGVPHAAGVLQRAEVEVQAARRVEAAELLDLARRGLEAADLDQARYHLGRLDASALAQDRRAEPESIRSGIARLEAVRHLTDLVDRALADDDLLGARRHVHALVQTTDGEEHREWEDRLRDLQHRIRQVWSWATAHGGDGVELTGVDLRGATGGSSEILAPGGRQLVATTTEGRWVFVWQVELPAAQVIRRVMLRTPEPLVAPTSVSVTEGMVYIMGRSGRLLQLDARTLDVAGWSNPVELLHPLDRDRGVTSSLSGGALWLTCGIIGSGGGACAVVDLKRGRIERRLDLVNRVPISGGGDRMALCQKATELCRPYSLNGRRLLRPTIPAELNIVAAAAHAEGDGIVLLHTDGRKDAASRVMVTGIAEDGAATSPLDLPGLSPVHSHALATSRSAGLTYLLATTRIPSRELVALRVSRDRVRQVFRVSAPRDSLLALDQDSTHVAIAAVDDAGTRLTLLGSEPPDLGPRDHQQGAGQIPRLDVAYCQCGPRGGVNDRVLALIQRLRALFAASAEELILRLQHQHAAEPDYLSDLSRARAFCGRAGLPGEEAAWHHDPDHPPAASDFAHLKAEQRDWQAVKALLAPLAPARLDPARAQHRLHLLGLAAYMEGDVERARECWSAGLDVPAGECELGPCLELASAVTGASPAGTRSETALAVEALRRADQRLQRGDAAGAARAVDAPWTWRYRELQGLARLARAQLRLDVTAVEQTWDKVFALAAFCQRYRPVEGGRKLVPEEVLVPGQQWDDDQLARLFEQSQAWLDGAR